MNIGGDPGRDDYGLPPVEIEVPDDARELDREVQAYRRELRALRWRRRTRWLVVPLGRDGMVLPLLAGCLALTLLAGTLLTVFSGERMTPPSLARSSHQLPNAIVLVDVDGSVAAVARDRGKGFQLAAQMHSLVPHPGGTGTASVAAGPAGG